MFSSFADKKDPKVKNVLEASLLKVMRFGVLWRNNEWRADHRKHLILNDKVSAEAEFVFETSSGQILENLFAH